MYLHKKNYRLALLLVLALSAFGSCQKNTSGDKQPSAKKALNVKINQTLPKEIIVNDKMEKIIDSLFSINNSVKTLVGVNVYILKNSILTASNRKYLPEGILTSGTTYVFDENGNPLETNTTFHLKNSYQNYSWERDSHGNITRIQIDEGGKKTEIRYENEYEGDNLVRVTCLAGDTGEPFEKRQYTYDSNGNMTQEWIQSSEAKNIYSYNKQNKVVLYKHVRNGQPQDSLVYSYNKNLLIKETRYSAMPTPSVTQYSYNAKGQLTEEKGEYIKKIYEGYDTYNNWQSRTYYEGKTPIEVLKRTYVYP